MYLAELFILADKYEDKGLDTSSFRTKIKRLSSFSFYEIRISDSYYGMVNGNGHGSSGFIDGNGYGDSYGDLEGGCFGNYLIYGYSANGSGNGFGFYGTGRFNNFI